MWFMVLRLDPRYPVIWRDLTSLQIGAETPIATIPNISAPFERLIGALMAGVSQPEFERLAERLGIAADELPGFLDRISPALAADPVPATRPGWVVDGTGPTAQRVASLLEATGLPAPDPAAHRRPGLVVLVATHVIDPRRYIRWLSLDIPHLAVVYTDTGARVGPLVEPGAGPCLHCLARHNVERDPAWPAIASQLLGQGAASEREPLVSVVAGLAARLAEVRLVNGTNDLDSASLSFDAQSLTGRRAEHRQHPDCGCRSLSGSATVPATASHDPVAHPTT